MVEGHIPEELLGRFLRAEVSREEAQWTLRHLLSRCPPCLALSSRMTAELGLYSKTKTWEEAYEEVFARTLAFATEQEERLAVEKLRGWGQWAGLESATPQERLAGITWELIEQVFSSPDTILEARIRGTAGDGGSACATVPLLEGGWKVLLYRGPEGA